MTTQPDGEPFAPTRPAAESPGSPTRTHVGIGDYLAPGTTLSGRYRIEGVVGLGGMGIVYRARDLQLELPVAIKVLRPEHAHDGRFLERFRRELILARQVSHRNVVRIHDIGQDGDLHFLTMDLVEGTSLRDLLEQGGPMPLVRAVYLVKQLARALAGAHVQGVIHRDLKPDNILVDPDDNAYITDFGIARSLGGIALTRTGMVVGTPNYLSPEQARGEAVDGRSDLYALGIIFFEMLADALPFRGGTDAEVLAQRLAGAPTLVALDGKVPASAIAVLRKLLERDPARRYQSAPELLADLDTFEKPTASRFLPQWVARLPPSARPARRTAAIAAAAVLVTLGVAALMALRLRSGTAKNAAPVAAEGNAVPTVAVLPLADETGHPELAWTGRAVAEMLAAALADSPGLRVVDSLRVFRTLEDLGVKGEETAGPQVDSLGELLEADRLLAGRVRATGATLRLELRLVGATLPAGGAALQAEARSVAELPAAVRALATAVEARLAVPRGEQGRAGSARPQALAAYVHGLDRLVTGDAVGALPWLQQATAADPRFTAGWLRLADAYETLGRPTEAGEALDRAAADLGNASPRTAVEVRSKRALLAGDPAGAERLLAALEPRYPHDVELLVALANARGEAGKLDAARAALTRATLLDPKHPRAWYLLGKYAIQGGDARKAVDDYLVHALVLQNQLGNAQGRADVLNALGVGFEQLGRLAEAADNYGKAAAVRQQIGDIRGYAATQRNLARLDTVQGRSKDAAARLDEARRQLEKVGDHRGLADVLNDLGVLAEERGRYRQALVQYREALQAREALGDPHAVAESYNNVGFAYYLLGEYDNAAVYWRQALDLYRQSGDRQGIVQARQSMGLLQLSQGRWEDAAKTLVSALDESRAQGMRDTTAASLAYLGHLGYLQGRYGAALDSYRRAKDVVRQLGDLRGLVEFTLGEAETLLAAGDADAAASRLDQAGQWLATEGNEEQRARLLMLRGRLELWRGHLPQARDAFAHAVATAGESDTPILQLEARSGAAMAALAAGDAAGASRALANVAAEAKRRGDVPLRLQADAELARAELVRARPAEAASAARDGLAALPTGIPWGGTYRLQAALAAAAQALGQPDTAVAARQRATAELARLRRELPPELRPRFDAQPEIRELATPGAASR